MKIIKISVRYFSVLYLLLIFSGAALSAQETVLKTVQADEYFAALDQERRSGKGILLDVRTGGWSRNSSRLLAVEKSSGTE